MNITGVTIKEACVLDCGQAAKPGDSAVVIEIVMRCNAVAIYYMKEVIEAALSNVAKQPMAAPHEQTPPKPADRSSPEKG